MQYTLFAAATADYRLKHLSLAGFAAGAAIGIIILICIFILVCDRRRRPYIGAAASRPLGMAAFAYTAHAVQAIWRSMLLICNVLGGHLSQNVLMAKAQDSCSMQWT